MIKDRKDIDKRYKWDLSVIYADEKAFYTDYAIAEKAIKAFPKFEKKMLKNIFRIWICFIWNYRTFTAVNWNNSFYF